MKNVSWSFQGVWNQSLEQREVKPLEARERIWASELGGAMVDRYLKMTATPMSNTPNPRSLRKFEAGNLMEWVAGVILKRAGILKASQEWLPYQYPGLLKVTGKYDYTAGGKPDYERGMASLKELSDLGLHPIFEKIGSNIVEYFSKKYPDGLKEITLEIKSCSSFSYDKYERTKKPGPQHILQSFHYLKAENKEEAHVVYISKDDLRMIEFGVFNPSTVEEDYKKDIEQMTKYLKDKVQPPLERPVSYDEDDGRFFANWKMGYSNYLTMLYGYKDQNAFDTNWKPTASKWNRIFKRCVQGKTMTKLNLEIIPEVKKEFPA